MKQDKANFSPKNRINLFIVCRLDVWLRHLIKYKVYTRWLFGTINLMKNANPDKYEYSGYGIGFDACSQFLLPMLSWVKMVLFLM